MEPLTLDPSRSALVVIDMAKGILSFPSKPYPVPDILANTVHLAEAARQTGTFVVLVHVDFVDDKDRLHPITDAETRMSAQRPAGWADIAPELGPRPSDHVVTKRQWGAFFGTDLDLQLRRRGIDTIILCGIATNIGVETTAREAYQHGYNQVFAEDAMNALSEEEHRHSCTYLLPRMGRIRSTDEIVAAINAGQSGVLPAHT
jgi:nicotinamidase-related amidase